MDSERSIISIDEEYELYNYRDGLSRSQWIIHKNNLPPDMSPVKR